MEEQLREYLKVLGEAIQEYHEVAAQNLELGLTSQYHYWQGVSEGACRARADLINLINDYQEKKGSK